MYLVVIKDRLGESLEITHSDGTKQDALNNVIEQYVRIHGTNQTVQTIVYDIGIPQDTFVLYYTAGA